MDVYLVWHVHHAAFADGSPTEHFDEDGDLIVEEDEGDDLKILGVFASREAADQRIELARTESGFRDEPECFYVATYQLDEPLWLDGFVAAGEDGDSKVAR